MRIKGNFVGVAIVCGLLSGCTQNVSDSCPIVKEKFVHKYGVEIEPSDWSARGQHGKIISTLANGVTVSKNYEAGILNGPTTYTYPHSDQIEKVETYQSNNVVKEQTFYASGVPKQELNFQPDGSIRALSWYENGSPKTLEEYDSKNALLQGQYYDIQHNLDGWVDGKEGMRVTRDGYGQLISRDTVHDGSIVSRTTYHPNGTPKAINCYKNGIIDGECRTFLPAGEPASVEQWENGRQHGTTVLYQNGEKFAEVPYSCGNKHGVERRYKDGTTVIEETSWKNGLKHGPSVKYVEGVVSSEWFYQGQPVTRGNFEILIRSPSE